MVCPGKKNDTNLTLTNKLVHNINTSCFFNAGMTLQRAPTSHADSEVKQDNYMYTDVIIRSFQSGDSHMVRNIFAQSMGEMRGPLVHDVMWQATLYGLLFLLPGGLLNYVWPLWSLKLYIMVLFALLLTLFVALHIGFSRYIQTCLDTDLDNVESIYLCQKKSHMWVAELHEKIIGMVALVPLDDHEDSFGKRRETVGRLRRMAVLPEFRRLGVARKLLNELLNYAREIGYEQVVLLTTSAQQAALNFYPKHGFKLVTKRLANRALRGFYHYVYCYDLERRIIVS